MAANADSKRAPSAAERLLGKSGPRHEPEVEAVRNAFESNGDDPKSRGRAAIMLDVRKADGQRHAMSYAYLTQVDFEPGDRMKLHFAGQVVQLQGRRLRSLYERLLDHRLLLMQEGTDAEDALKPETEPHIERIDIIKQKEADHDDD